MSDSSSSAESNEIEVLDQLTGMFQAAHEAVLAAESNALDSAIKAGTILLTIQERIVGSMKAWMTAHMPNVGVSTYKLYLQLADPDNRRVIEAARKTDPYLSIRAARKLLVKKKPASPPSTDPAGAETETTGAVVPVVISDEQLIAALTAR